MDEFSKMEAEFTAFEENGREFTPQVGSHPLSPLFCTG